MGHARNVLVVEAGRAVVALPGSNGTLSEVAVALKIGRPVVGVAAWGEVAGVETVEGAEEAVARAFARAEGSG
jgi:predicted Rossmann-fold nucleotide-binding protein